MERFLPLEDIWQCLDTFWVVMTCIEWVEARGGAKHSTMHRPAPTTEKDLCQHVNGVKFL